MAAFYANRREFVNLRIPLPKCTILEDMVEKEALRLRGGIVEIKDGAFLAFIGQGVAGSLASAPLVVTIETIWS